MARPKYLKPSKREYAGDLSRMRAALDKLFDFVRRSPQSKPDVVQTFKTFANATGIDLNQIPSTSVVVASGVKVTAPAITGSYTNGYTFTIVGGVITAIVAS
ncbi:hypothetical protein RHEph03_gp056 [Rhizobium phage RHEph03]|uniref:Uncharacterized protein n=2 Tax=Cuernavacavirus RHEph02 TaxID=2733899 RepID=L7TJJ1_9CAUD|nr:hypothetical protein HOS21_gp56 [Rhizobium phage RHEph02]AGC35623.1 hypothetical protein RHEph02_gp056 [Rhizobium phage RHEph02]AGC35683.1 hypothetical protein RHEph03_gp056 [Rhizobium phage RHEph03]